jgi:hypothetical protein
MSHSQPNVLFKEHDIIACSETQILNDAMAGDGFERIDTFRAQLKELFRCKNPSLAPGTASFEQLWTEFAAQNDRPECGNWVRLPWLFKWVRILEESDFLEVLRSRNKNKIRSEEQRRLARHTILVIGLSVGQTAAITLAMEGVGGCLRLVDFDSLDLSNLNRLRSGVHEIGLLKSRLSARRITELNPYQRVELCEEGASPENLPELLEGVDVLIEECDSLPIKICARLEARSRKIPVVMDTSDRGMIDIERFDQEPDRPLFHGSAGEIDAQTIEGLNARNGMDLMKRIVEFDKTSERMRESFSLLGSELISWPQLASEVTSGGAFAVQATRQILLGQKMDSGRYYLELAGEDRL